MAWRYARKPILPVRICVITELMARWVSAMDFEYIFSWLDPETVEFSTVLGVFPGHVPLVLHPLADVGFCGGRQGP